MSSLEYLHARKLLDARGARLSQEGKYLIGNVSRS